MKKPPEIFVRFCPRLNERLYTDEPQGRKVSSFVAKLSLHLENLLADLGINHKFDARVAGPGEPGSRFLFSLEIGGSSCDGPLDRNPIPDYSVEHLLRLVMDRLYTNRHSLLAEALVDREWERVAGPNQGKVGVSRPDFQILLSAAIRHGLEVPKMIDDFLDLCNRGTGQDEFSDQVEAVIAVHSDQEIPVHVGSLDSLKEPSTAEALRKRLFLKTGIVFPPISFIQDESIAKNEFRIQVNRLRTGVQTLGGVDPMGDLENALAVHAPVFATISEIDSALGRFCDTSPMMVFNAIEAFGTGFVHRVLRTLVEEAVNIRDLRTILGAMLEINGTLPLQFEREKPILPYSAHLLAETRSGEQIENYVDGIRFQLRHQICQSHADARLAFNRVRIPSLMESRLSRAGEDPLTEEERFALRTSIDQMAEGSTAGTVLVASRRNRRRLLKLIREDFLQLPLLSEEELSPYLKCLEQSELEIF